MTDECESKKAIRIHRGDNVATVIDDLEAGDAVSIVERDGTSFDLLVSEAIPFGHKVALDSVRQDADVVKYGSPIGVATAAIRKGQHVHVHNLRSKRARGREDDR